MNSFINWLERNMMSCFYKKYFGIECPGCGMQRAFVELLKGNFVESFKLFPALLPIIFMFIFLVLHLIFKFEKGGLFIKYMFIFTTLTMIISYLYKILII